MGNTSKQKKSAASARAKQRSRPKSGSSNQLAEQNAQLQQAMMNIRTMYDQAVMEREGLRQQIAQRDQVIVAAVVAGGGVLEIPSAAMASVEDGEWSGYDVERLDDGLLLVVVPGGEEEPELDVVEEVPDGDEGQE